MNKQPTRKAPAATASQVSNPVRLSTSHGYCFSGEKVQLNAELQLPAYLTRGDYALELWACATPCESSDGQDANALLVDPANQPGSVRVASLALQLPTPLAPLSHIVEGEAAAQLPLPGTSYAMVLALVHEPAHAQRAVVDLANYSRREVFSAPLFQGEVSYEVHDHEVVLYAQGIANERAEGNESGTLSLELWAYDAATQPSAGIALASVQLAPIYGGYFVSQVACRTSLKQPPAGQWRTAMLLREWTEANGFVTRDQRITATLDVAGAAPVAESAPTQTKATPVEAKAVTVEAKAAPVTTQPVAAAVAKPAAPIESKLVVEAKPAAAASKPVAPAAPVALVSLQTASLEELSKLEGLNARIAKELIKARPLSAWTDVLKVRGVGEATLKKLKTLATL
jgi:DNA uptake protein ComE-like DNA-binding protein